jgi:hypothetical protein
MGRPRNIGVGPVRSSRRDGTFRAAADVQGVELAFETEGAPLAPRPEAFASALLPAAVLSSSRAQASR